MNEEKTVVETQEEIDELETAAMETAEEENAEELPESDDATENGAAEEGGAPPDARHGASSKASPGAGRPAARLKPSLHGTAGPALETGQPLEVSAADGQTVINLPDNLFKDQSIVVLKAEL